MSKGLGVLFTVTMFALGISIGLYANMKTINEEKTQITKLDSVQDIVTQTVQEEQNTKYNVEEVNNELQEKVSPYAKITIEKFYTQCGHTTVDIIDVPKELINLTESELKEKYNGWEMQKFNSKEIYLYREIDANCLSHFVIREKDGYIAVYNIVSDELTTLKEITDIEILELRDEDKEAIEAGVDIYGQAELQSFIEDFNS